MGILFLTAFQHAQSQSLDYNMALQYTPGGAGDRGNNIVTDASGNVYMCGSFEGTVNFNPWGQTENRTSAGAEDCFVMKISPSGITQWVHSFGSTGSDVAVALMLDGAGGLYVTGGFTGTVDFDPGVSVVSATSTASSVDVFLVKLGTDGTFYWANAMGGSSTDMPTAIALSGSGLVMTGFFSGTADFDPGVGTANLTSAGDEDVFVLRMNLFGGLLWAKAVGGTFDDRGNAIMKYYSQVLITGYFAGTADFNPDAGVANVSSNGGRDVFILVLNEGDGSYSHVRGFGSTSNDEGLTVAFSPFNEVLLGGYFGGSMFISVNSGNTGAVTLSPQGARDGFVIHFSPNYMLYWARQIGRADVYCIATDANGRVYAAGRFYGTSNFDPAASQLTYVAYGGYDAFVAVYDGTGTFQTGKRWGGTSDEFASSVAIAGGAVYTTGAFSGICNMNTDGATADYQSSAGTFDAFLHKMQWCSPTNTTQTESACSSFTWGANNTTYTSSGSYTATLTSTDGCDSVVTLNLNVYPAPNPVIVQNGPVLSTQTTFSGYQWQLNGNNINGATGQNYTPTQSGSYTVVVIDANGCTSTSAAVNVTVSDISEAGENKILIYPNPVADLLNISPAAGSQFTTVELLNELGQVALSASLSSGQHHQISMRHLPAGIYQAVITHAGQRLVKKIIRL